MTALLVALRKKAMSVVVWQTLFVLSVVWGFASTHMAVKESMSRMRFVAMDSRDTMYLSAAGSFEEASHVRLEMAKLATETMFNRSPDGFTDGDRLERLFAPGTATELNRDATKDSEAFKTQQIHQSVETGTIREIKVDSNTALVSVEAQILRTGIFNNRVQNYSRKATVFLRLKVNDNMAYNGRYPLVVTEYKENL